MLLPLRIRTHISCEETLYGGVCSRKLHAVHPGHHHHQPHTNHRYYFDFEGITANSLLREEIKNFERKRTAREAGWTGKRRQGGRLLRGKGSGGKSWIKETIGSCGRKTRVAEQNRGRKN